MSKMTLLDKLGIFLEVSKSSIWYMLLIIVFLAVGIIFLHTNKRNATRNKIIYIMISTFVIVVLVSAYHSSLSKIFDYMMNNLFIAIYFPNLAIYMAALIIMNIILWTSLFHFKTSEMIKKLNVVVYIIMNYLLVLIINIINKENLDIFAQDSVYGNEKALALIELSSTLFMIWIIFLILYKIILIYLRKDYKPKVKKVIVKEKKLPANYDPTVLPTKIKGNVKTTSTKQLLNVYENTFTLEDYKLMSRILKEQKPVKVKTQKTVKEKEEKPVIMRDIEQEKQRLERLKIEIEKQREFAKEEAKYTDLERLYRGIR